MDRHARSHAYGMSLVLASAISFSLMSLFVRMGRDVFRADTFVFSRSLIQALFLLPWVAGFWSSSGGFRVLLRVHLFRGVVGVFSMWMLYYALGRLPLVLVSLLTMTSVLWALLLGRLFLGEAPAKHRIVLATLVLVGFVIVLWPEKGMTEWSFPWDGIAAALASGVSMGIAQTLIRQMRATRSVVEIVFWFGLIGATLTAFPYFAHPEYPQNTFQWGILLATGLAAIGGQVLMTAGFRYTPAFLGSLCALSGNLWNLLLGMGLLGEVPPAHFWLGAIVALSAMVLLMRPQKVSLTFWGSRVSKT